MSVPQCLDNLCMKDLRQRSNIRPLLAFIKANGKQLQSVVFAQNFSLNIISGKGEEKGAQLVMRERGSKLATKSPHHAVFLSLFGIVIAVSHFGVVTGYTRICT